MSTIRFILDDKEVEARPGESLWQVAQRQGTDIPHLCYSDASDYRADGNCRACVVEIEGERVLAASCVRTPTEGMRVHTQSQRAGSARAVVMELLLTDQPTREASYKQDSSLWKWADTLDAAGSRFPSRSEQVCAGDASHPAIRVNRDACIHCNLCVRACREVQVNDVIGFASRGAQSKIVFDLDDPMGASTCVACGECVQACPTGALMASGLLDEQGLDRRLELDQTHSVCPYCGVGCQITYQTLGNEIVAVEGRDGPSNRNRLCVKGRFGFDYVNHPHRLTRPLIRRADAPKSADCQVDPANPYTHFRDADWEEAITFAAMGLRSILESRGSGALAGLGSAKCSNEEAYLFQKLLRAGFGTNNVDHCTRLCHASSVAALLEGIGSGSVTAPFSAANDADVIIIIGSNTTENHPVAASFFKQAAKTKTLIVMDPRGNALKRHASHMLQFKPGTDVAMLNAVLNVIIEEHLYDAQYIQNHTEGFDALAEHVRNYSPEAMQDICGIDANTIRTVARLYAGAERAIIFWGMGVSQHVHGTDNVRCLIALAMITGHVGRAGTGLHPLRGQNNVQGASDAGLIPMMFPDYKLVTEDETRRRFEKAWGMPLDPEKGLTVVEMIGAIHAGDLCGMYIMGENPAMSDPDALHAREALAKLKHLVVQDIFLTETAFHADVILPASAWPEKTGTVTNTNRQIQMGRQAIHAPGQARQDWRITLDIAKAMGMDWDYSGPDAIFAEMKTVMESLNNITWQRLERQGAVTTPCDGPDIPGNAIVFGAGFPTASGRATLVPAGIIAPDEQPDAEYPMVLTTGRQLEHWHTGSISRRASVLDTLEPEATVSLSATDLRELGLKPGEVVRVTTRRGMIELKARVDSAIPCGMIFIPFCYAEAAANILTNPALDPFGKIPEFKYCAARLEKTAS